VKSAIKQDPFTTKSFLIIRLDSKVIIRFGFVLLSFLPPSSPLRPDQPADGSFLELVVLIKKKFFCFRIFCFCFSFFVVVVKKFCAFVKVPHKSP
jgi:hypothetical protein